MQNKRIQSVFLILFCPVILAAQNFFISKFVPGNFQKDNRHLVDIFNPGPQPLDISNYLLVTRDYVAKIARKDDHPTGGSAKYLQKLHKTFSDPIVPYWARWVCFSARKEKVSGKLCRPF